MGAFVGREEQQGRLWGMQCGSPRTTTALAGEAMAGGRPGEEGECVWREERGHRRGYSWARERRVRGKGNVGHLPVQTRVTEQTPGRSNSTPSEPEGNHLKFKDKWAEGEGVATVCEEPPRRPSQAPQRGQGGALW